MFARCPRSRWIRDEDVSFCQVCDVEFGLTTRRHHCRCCGRCVCAQCLVDKRYADGGTDKTCKDCIVQQRNNGSPTSPLQQQSSGGYPAQQQGYPPQQQGYPPQQQGYPPQQQGYPPQQQGYPAQQQQGYPPQQQAYPPQQQTAAAMYPPIGGATQYPTSDACDEALLQQICAEFEMKPLYLPPLHALLSFDVALVCDDSGSMALQADDDNPNLTRWAELKQAVNIILRVTAAMGKTVDVYFINRGVFRGIQTWQELAPQFARPPGGMTNTVRILQQLWSDRIQAGTINRPFVCHLFTDGHPTNSMGNEDINGFAQWMRCRQGIANTYFSILLCTDDEEVCNMYRPLEYRVNGRFGWTGPTCGIQGVDVTEDYRGEKRDILALRGQRYSFTFGDYIAKCLVGVIDPMVHMIDLPQGASLYRTGGGGGGGGCSNQ